MLSGLKDLIHKGNIDSAKAMCTALNTPEAAMLEKGLNRIGQPIQDIREAMNETAEVEIGKLEKLSDFDLTNEAVKKKMKERYGDKIPTDETVISPAAIFDSELLTTVKEN